jgi:hypothetical protein
MKAVPSKEASTSEQASEASLFDRISRVVEAFGKFIKYLFGFFVFILLVAWLTDGFSANWLEVLVLVLTGIGIYKLERRRAEKVAREQGISIEEAIEERREQFLENSTLLIFILIILGFFMTSKIDGDSKKTFAAYLFFCFFIVYLYDLFVPRKRAKRKVFDIEPDGFGYKVYAFRKPNGKRRRQVRQNRDFRRVEDGEKR